MARLETRVARIAEALLAERRSVRPIDVLVGLGWLAQPNVDRWEQGRVPSLDRCVGVDSDKVTAALAALQHWAEDRGLTPSEADYQDLQFTADGDSDAERAYRTHWASTDIPEPIVERTTPSPTDHRDLSTQRVDVRIVRRHRRLPSSRTRQVHCVWTAPTSATSSFCLPAMPRSPGAPRRPADCPPSWCAGAHDAIAMSGKGILAEAAAIEQAAQECLSDADVRARRRERDAEPPGRSGRALPQ